MTMLGSGKIAFSYYPQPLTITAGPISIETLPGLDEAVADVTACETVEGDWLYAPMRQVRHFGGGITESPYQARVFGLARTHTIEHRTSDDPDHIAFHLWSLSFFTGMRLTATEAGFLDATPIKPGKLVDFIDHGDDLARSIVLAEAFWQRHAPSPVQAKRFAAAVHALFLAQNPQNLQFEQFTYLYSAIDACFAIACDLHRPAKKLNHADRTAWMCRLFGITPPAWAMPSAQGGPEIAVLRNAAVHEALFVGEPLGFALHGVGSNQNLTLEMEALVCRFLVALIGAESADYVRTPINTRQRSMLELP